MTAELRSPFHVRCLDCDAVFVIAYTPLAVSIFAEICINGRCPYCGSKSDRQTPAAGPSSPPALKELVP